MTQTPGEPISDGDAPTGDPDLAAHEQPSPATEARVPEDHENDHEEQKTEEHLDADEGDPDLDSYPG